MEHIKKITPYRDINDVLDFLARGIWDIFVGNLVGFYLTGSLSYGDFDEGRSDIDLAAVLERPATAKDLDLVKKLHSDAEQKYDRWAKRIECSYIYREMLPNILPPTVPRPYVGEGKFYPEALYGNEWIINKYFLYQNGIALLGPDFKTLVSPVNIADLKAASRHDLYKEWVPKINDAVFLENSHYQSYVVLNLCRILYTVINGGAVSKKVAAVWAKTEYPQWKNLIETAAGWHYGMEMKSQSEAIDFIKFAVAKVE